MAACVVTRRASTCVLFDVYAGVWHLEGVVKAIDRRLAILARRMPLRK